MKLSKLELPFSRSGHPAWLFPLRISGMIGGIVTIEHYGSGVATMDALLEGKADLAHMTEFVLVQNALLLVDLPQSEWLAAISSGNVDAIIGWPPYSIQIKQHFRSEAVAWQVQSDQPL